MSSIRRLENDLQVIATAELNEVPDRIEGDLSHVREWFRKQPHLKYKNDDQWLVTFLRGCKFSLQKAKEKIDYFYTLRTLIPEFFADRDPYSPENQEILKAGCIFPLPRTNGPAGPRVFVFRFKDSETMPLVNLMRMYFMSLDIAMQEDDNSVVAGIFLWADFSTFPLSYLPQYTPSFIKKSLACLFKMYPLRLKGLCCTNAPAVFEHIVNFSKSIVTTKVSERIALYSKDNFEKIYNHIPREMLPKDFGGEADPMQELGEQWRSKVESYREWFLEETQYYSNEGKRIGAPQTTSDLFGIEGSFRKLCVD